MKVKFKKLVPHAQLPTYAHEGDAGMDLRACFNEPHKSETLLPGDTALIPTGLSMELPEGYEAQIRPRSGIALKYRITVLNSPGTVDCHYRGPIGVVLINHGPWHMVIENGMKIAQMVIKPVEQAEIEEVEELSNTERGEGGFGSTGDK